MTWIGLSCLCRGANCELLVTKGNERWGADSWLAEKVSASQEEPRSTASARYYCPCHLVLYRQPHRTCVSVSSPDTAVGPRHLVLYRQPHRTCVSVSSPDTAAGPSRQTLSRSSPVGRAGVTVDTRKIRGIPVLTQLRVGTEGSVGGEGRGRAGTTDARERSVHRSYI